MAAKEIDIGQSKLKLRMLADGYNFKEAKSIDKLERIRRE